MKGSCITKWHIFQINFHQIISAYRKRYTTNYVQIGLIENWKAMLYKNLFAGAVWKDHETIIWIYLSKALNFTPHNLLKVNRFKTKCYNEHIYSALWNIVSDVSKDCRLDSIFFNIFFNNLFLHFKKSDLKKIFRW